MRILQGQRGPHSAVTEEMLPQITKLHEEGHCAAFIARTLKVPPKALYPIMRRMGLAIERRRRRSGITAEQWQLIVHAYVGGEGTKSLARQYGVTDGTITRYLREVGVQLRPAGFQQGEGHHAWKGGRILTDDGYVLVLVRPDDPFYPMAQVKTTDARYCLEHRLVMARHLGRLLTDEETVHHIDDRDRSNNELTNLQLRRGRHGKSGALQCSDCGSHNIIAVPLASPTKH